MTDAIGEALYGDRTIYSIPEQNYARFEKEMAKLSRRSERLIGLPIKPFAFGNEMKLDVDGRPLYRIIQVYLTAEVPVIDGWTFVARLDHSNETGTVIRRVPNVACDIPERYRDCKPNCDHCRVLRKRRDTFLIRNDETGAFQQVGSNCLTDFFGGHDPYKIAKLAEMLGYADETARAATTLTEDTALHDRRWVNMEEFLAFCAKACREHGWVSGKAARRSEEEYEWGQRNTILTSTRQRAMSAMLFAQGHPEESQYQPTPEDERLAADALDRVRLLEQKPDLEEFEHNLLVVANAVYVEGRSCGIAAYIVGGFFEAERRRKGLGKAVQLGDMTGVIALMKRPGSKMKYPKISLMIEDTKQPIELSIAGERSKCPGSVNITDGGPYGANVWFGRIAPDGTWTPSRSVNETTMSSLVALLSALAQDPAGVATRFGRLTGRCCFCNKALTVGISTTMGYGQSCAKNYNLPWGKKAADALMAAA